jgi:HEAT repeat protein
LVIGVVAAQWILKRMNADKLKNAEKNPSEEISLTGDEALENLASKDLRTRLRAIQALAESPNLEHVPALVEMLHDTAYDVREAASTALIAHGEEAVMNTITILQEGDIEAREMAIKVLAALPTQASIEALEQALLHDESSWVRIPAAEALGNLGEKANIHALIRALSDQHPDVYQALVHALQQIGTDEALQAISQYPYQPKEE